MRLRFITVGLLVALQAGCAAPKSPPFSTEQVRILDEALAEHLEATDLPGLVALITTADSVVYRRALGTVDPSKQRPMTEDAIFRIHSMTKPITSVALMMLHDRGLLELDDAASMYVDDLGRIEVLVAVDTLERTPVSRPPSRDITVRDLLRHTSGFGYTFSNHALLRLANHTDRGGADQFLLHDPGDRWTYGMGTGFVGTIIEQLTDRSLVEFFETEIFGPLGMSDTSFDLPPSKMSRLVADVWRVEGELQAQPMPDSVVGYPAGDSGLLSTADDYARFVQLILGGGERAKTRLLSEAAIEEMSRDQLGELVVTEQQIALPEYSNPYPAGSGTDGFALGFQVSRSTETSRRPPGSLSWGGLANTHFWVDRDHGIGVIMMFQIIPFYDDQVMSVVDGFEEALYGEVLNGR